MTESGTDRCAQEGGRKASCIDREVRLRELGLEGKYTISSGLGCMNSI